MPSTITRPFAALLLLVVGTLTPPLSAQSASELRNENLDLKAQVRELTRELDAARSEIADLRKELTAVKRQLAAAQQQPRRGEQEPRETEPERVTVDESKPSASPRALLRAMREGYESRFEDIEVGADNTPQRIAYMRHLDGWQKSVAREFRSKIEWHVRRVDDEPGTSRRGFVRFVAVDPQTDVRLGEPFAARRPRQRSGMVSEAMANGDVLVMKGVLRPAVTINREVERAGPFNESVFIGAFALFGFDVDVNSLTLPEKAQEAKDRG